MSSDPNTQDSFLLQTLTVDDAGTQLAYIDSGAPDTGLSSAYITIFAIHGVAFAAPIFQKTAKLAPSYGLRFVAINRRDYPGSSPISADDINTLESGTDAEKAQYLENRGLEILRFIDAFVQKYDLPPISQDGKGGGIALLGWSLGSAFSLAAISSTSKLEAGVKERLGRYIRSHILQEPPSATLGSPQPPGTGIDKSITPEFGLPFSLEWLTSYFKHGDLSTKNPNLVTSVLSTTSRAASIFNMDSQLSQVFFPAPIVGSDGLLLNFALQLSNSYKNACFDSEIRALFPKMKVWELLGSETVSPCVFAFWAIQDDDVTNGGNQVNFKVIPGANHFVQWDDPSIAIEVYKEGVA